ncbi:MAG TPA: VWA domain-containing protein [Terracidiphilus sp.]|nr:VWA domain-containing protein [Terracidiphilus sp.]
MGCAAACGQAAANAVSSAQDTQPPLVRTQAYTVLVDVVATKKGNAVLDLDQKQFHILEDGHEQAIVFFEEHKAATRQQVVQRRALPPHTYNNLPVEPPGSAVNVLLLDALNTPMGDQLRVRQQMIKFLETIPPGTTMAVFTLSSRLRMVQGFTSDAGLLAAALKGARTTPYKSPQLDGGVTDSGMDAIVSGLQMIPGTGADIAGVQQFQSEVTTSQTDQRIDMTIEALRMLARYLSAVPGRKNLIWFSGSFPILAFPDARGSAAESYGGEVRNVSEMLAAARVAVYPMSAQGLATSAALDAGYGGIGPAPRDPSLNNRFTMEEIAEQTGGMALFNNNGFAQAVVNAIDNGSSYYTIGYVPADKNFHGQFRKLKANVEGCDCQLSYRRGYYSDPPDKPSPVGVPPAAIMTSATLHGAPPSTQVLFQARVLPESDPLLKDFHLPEQPIGAMAKTLKKPYSRYIADIAVDPRTLSFTTGAGGARDGNIEFTLVAYDAEGKRVNYVDRTTHLTLNAGQYGQIMASGLPVRLAMEMPGGHDFLVIAVHDMISARVGSIEIPLEVPAR